MHRLSNTGSRRIPKRFLLPIKIVLILICQGFFLPTTLFAQLNENCTVSIFNRTAQVQPNGDWEINNLPTNIGLARARVTCTENGLTAGGQSSFVTMQPNGVTGFDATIPLGAFAPIPESLTITPSASVLTASMATSLLTVMASYPGGGTADVSLPSTGTTYTVSNPSVATVNNQGVVTAVSSGRVVVSALNEGVLGLLELQVQLSGDSDGDGIPDDAELLLGLDPNNPVDALEDFDGDGIINLTEFQNGTDIRDPTDGTNGPDADNDGLTDAEEQTLGTDPLNPDTDGDTLLDGVEARLSPCVSPLEPDTDGDGFTDELEDCDSDGLTNQDELSLGTDPGNADTDNDGTRDGFEINVGCNPLEPEITTVVGIVREGGGAPFDGAIVSTAGERTSTNSIGQFSISNVAACLTQPLRAIASARQADGQRLRGRSVPIIPNQGGTSDAGEIILTIDQGPLFPFPAFPVGFDPMDVKAGDINGDGLLDLVVVNNDTNDVSVLLSMGKGHFQPEQRYPVGNGPVSVAIGDMNNDLILDLIVANRSADDISLLLGNGDGTFQPEVRVAELRQPFILTPDSIAGGDLDGRSGLDVAVAGTNTVALLYGNGDGTFQPNVRMPVGTQPKAIQIVDITGEGFNDLLVANERSQSVSVLIGNGDGTFQPDQQFDAGVRPTAFKTADLNGDLILDLVVTNVNSFSPPFPPGTFSVLLGAGNGSFQSRRSFPTGFLPFVVQIADFNQDNRLDIATGNLGDLSNSGFGFSTVSIHLGNGDGTFQPQIDYSVSFNETPTVLEVGDFTGNGILDLIVGNEGADSVSTLLGNGDGSFESGELFGSDIGANALTVGDLNGDGFEDLLVSEGSGIVVTFLGNENNVFQEASRLTVGEVLTSIAIGDVNLDNIPDLFVMLFNGNEFSVFLGNGDGSFQGEQRFSGGNTTLELADLNEDGLLDVVMPNGDGGSTPNLLFGEISVVVGTENGTFRTPQRFRVGPDPRSVTVNDINGDGILDIVSANRDARISPAQPGSVSVLLGNGNGTFQNELRFPVGVRPSSVAISDFNNDGKLDIVTVNAQDNFRVNPPNPGDVSVLLGNGDGSFQPEQRFGVGINPVDAKIADLNADSIIDIIVANTGGGGDLSILLGNGDGTFKQELRFESRVIPRGLNAQDFDRDGFTDLVIAGGGGVSILLHR